MEPMVLNIPKCLKPNSEQIHRAFRFRFSTLLKSYTSIWAFSKVILTGLIYFGVQIESQTNSF